MHYMHQDSTVIKRGIFSMILGLKHPTNLGAPQNAYIALKVEEHSLTPLTIFAGANNGNREGIYCKQHVCYSG